MNMHDCFAMTGITYNFNANFDICSVLEEDLVTLSSVVPDATEVVDYWDFMNWHSALHPDDVFLQQAPHKQWS